MQLDAVADNCEDFLINRLDEAATFADYCLYRDIVIDYFTELRDLISKKLTGERNLVERAFGGDCARIARLRALLGAVGQVEPHHQVVSACSAVCDAVEHKLRHLGLSGQLLGRQLYERERLQALRHARRMQRHAHSQARVWGPGPTPWRPREKLECQRPWSASGASKKENAINRQRARRPM